MSSRYSNEEMRKEKRGLMFTMMQRKFENRVYEYLNSANISDMESLDRWLDKELDNYFKECDAIKAYYGDQYDG